MTDIDDVLEQCLNDLLTGASTLEECLARYPEHAEQLELLLRTAARVDMGSRVRPAPAFKVYTRNRIVSYVHAHPRRTAPKFAPFWRLMSGLVSILFALCVTGTVYAQASLPGDPFYPWKLTSEHAWRAVSADLVTTDIHIANRRIKEMSVTANDQAKWVRALKGYSEVHSRLEVEMDKKTLDKILPPIEAFSFPSDVPVTAEPVSEPPHPTETVMIPSTATEENGTGQDSNNDPNGKGQGNPQKTPTSEPTVAPTDTDIPETIAPAIPEPTVDIPEVIPPSPTAIIVPPAAEPKTGLPTNTSQGHPTKQPTKTPRK
jgi:hypothetical protein